MASKASLLFVVAAASLLTSGCTQRYKVKTPLITDYGAARSSAVPVTLHLTKDFVTYEHSRGFMGDTYIWPLGPSLAANSKEMARRLFTNLKVVEGESLPAQESGIILRPTVTSATTSQAMTAFDNEEFVIDVEWAMLDAAENILWVNTVRGIAKTSAGNGFTFKSQRAKRASAAMVDMFRKSYDAIAASGVQERYQGQASAVN